MHIIQIITLRVKRFMDLMILEDEGTLKKKNLLQPSSPCWSPRFKFLLQWTCFTWHHIN